MSTLVLTHMQSKLKFGEVVCLHCLHLFWHTFSCNLSSNCQNVYFCCLSTRCTYVFSHLKPILETKGASLGKKGVISGKKGAKGQTTAVLDKVSVMENYQEDSSISEIVVKPQSPSTDVKKTRRDDS